MTPFWLIAVVHFSVTVSAAEPPAVILSGTGNHPLFIAASAMVAADGTTASVVPEDWRVQREQLAQVLPKHIADVSAFGTISAVPCHGAMLLETPLEPLLDRTTRRNAIMNAHAIVAGRIRSVTPGFFFGTPGSLIELDSLDKITVDAAYSRVRDRLYIRLPFAKFVSGGTEYCRESGPGAYVPKVGDRLLVFAYDYPMDAAGTLVYSTSNDVISQPSGGAIRVPKSLSFFENTQATIASVVASIRSMLTEREQAEGVERVRGARGV